MLERSNSLRRRIDAWIDIQHLYIPSIAVIRTRADQQGGGKPVAVQNIELLLPSALLEKHLITFLRYEWQLRLTHALLLESSWQTKLQPLNEDDLSGLSSMDDSRSEGRKKLSWIWKVQGMDMDDRKNTHIGKRPSFFVLASFEIFLALQIEVPPS